MSSRNERNEAIALINMFTYLERELRVSLQDEHLASLTRAIADELKRRYGASSAEAFQLLEIDPRMSKEPQ